MGLTADETQLIRGLIKMKKTEVYILTWITHNVESKSKFQKHTVQQFENMQNNTIYYLYLYIHIQISYE